MKDLTHFMLDFETLSASSCTAPILSVGLVAFNPYGKCRKTDKFYTNIYTEGQRSYGAIPEESTIDWWDKQDPVAKLTLTINQVDVKTAITRLIEYLDMVEPVKKNRVLWSCDPDFDNVILQQWCKRLDIDYPFPYYRTGSVRTCKMVLRSLGGDTPSRDQYVHHYAIDDCLYQIKIVKMAHSIPRLVKLWFKNKINDLIQ